MTPLKKQKVGAKNVRRWQKERREFYRL